jgi:hypothetical protein
MQKVQISTTLRQHQIRQTAPGLFFSEGQIMISPNIVLIAFLFLWLSTIGFVALICAFPKRYNRIIRPYRQLAALQYLQVRELRAQLKQGRIKPKHLLPAFFLVMAWVLMITLGLGSFIRFILHPQGA